MVYSANETKNCFFGIPKYKESLIKEKMFNTTR